VETEIPGWSPDEGWFIFNQRTVVSAITAYQKRFDIEDVRGIARVAVATIWRYSKVSRKAIVLSY